MSTDLRPPDGRFSNYVSMTYNRFDPYNGYHNQDAATYQNYFAESQRLNNQFVDNFVFKFGKDNTQSLQVLYENISVIRYGNYGGVPNAGTFPGNPYALPYYNFDTLTQPGPGDFGAGVPGITGGCSQGCVQPLPYAPTSNVQTTTPEIFQTVNTRFLKFEYDNTINASTFLALRYYNWSGSRANSKSTRSARFNRALRSTRRSADRPSAEASTSSTRSATS